MTPGQEDLAPEQLRAEVDRALAAAEVAPADSIWGPTAATFRLGAMPGNRLREDGPLAWAERALTLHFFIHHDNRPTTKPELDAWLMTLTPDDVLVAVTFAVEVGLP